MITEPKQSPINNSIIRPTSHSTEMLVRPTPHSQINLASDVIVKDLETEWRTCLVKLQPNQNQTVAAFLLFGNIFIRIEYIIARKPSLVVFEGFKVSSDERIRLVQHVSQVNVLFELAEISGDRKPNPIGFVTEES